MTIPKTVEAVYFVSCDDPNFQLDPIAIRPSFESRRVMWEDTGPGTIVNLKKSDIEFKSKISKLPEKIKIETDSGKHITLSKMTLKLFNKYVKERAAGNVNFQSSSELQEYYLDTNFDYYGP